MKINDLRDNSTKVRPTPEAGALYETNSRIKKLVLCIRTSSRGGYQMLCPKTLEVAHVWDANMYNFVCSANEVELTFPVQT